jgi:hypothetical protein
MLPSSLNPLQLPDLWQQEAVRHLRSGADVIVDAPTGAGKTFVFESLVESRALRGQAIYTVPTRALANDKRVEWQRRKWRVGIATGEIAEDLGAPVVVATLETQRESLLAGRGPALLVVDEYQMLADPVRGLSYELALAVAPPGTQLLLLSGSVANATEVRDWLRRLGRRCELVTTRVRPVPLDEMPLDSLPVKAPPSITGFWPRLAVEVLLADLGPFLIFAPRRAQAEKIARQIAAVLPADDEVGLTEKQRHACGRDLSAVIEKRVAWHHSGLGYQARAGVVEPLAKAGKLRVIVATTGLAAGINFSVRSVLVAETQFFDGQRERQLRRDELLQMFGRAGRRGLDTNGWLVTTRTSPRLADAAPLRLKRNRDLDWPPLLRVMQLAAERGQSPVAAAERLHRSLFSESQDDLGLAALAAGQGAATAPGSGHSWFGLTPRHREVRNSRGEWEPLDLERVASGPLGAAHVWRNGRLLPALASPDFVRSLVAIGRVCRLPAEAAAEPAAESEGEANAHRTDPAPRYGRELALGPRAEGRRQYALTKQVRTWLGAAREATVSHDELAGPLLDRLRPHFEGGEPVGVVLQGELLVVQLDFAHAQAPLYLDRHGILLAGTEERDQGGAAETAGSRSRPAATTAPAEAATSLAATWLSLGLITREAVPTRRGVITSFFHQGEGLAVAAGLEQEALPIPDLVLLLANLRAGPRFSESASGAADPLALACRHAFGVHDVDGYLSLGLPPGYGEGAAEVIADLLHRPHEARRRWTGDVIGDGDLERAFAEWISLLRHIHHAPSHPWPRWTELKAAAAAELDLRAPLAPSRTLPEMPPRQLIHQPVLALSLSRLRRGG